MGDTFTVLYNMNCQFVSMNCLSNELPFAIHQIGFLDLQFIRQVLNSDDAAGAAASVASDAASVSVTAFAVVASEAAAEAAAPAAASDSKPIQWIANPKNLSNELQFATHQMGNSYYQIQ